MSRDEDKAFLDNMVEERVAELEQRAERAGRQHDKDAFVSGLHQVSQSTQGWLEKHGAQVQEMRVKHFLEARAQQRVLSNSPYAENLVRLSNPDDKHMEVLAGDFQRVWEKLEADKSASDVRWNIVCQVKLSKQKRARVVTVSLFTPQARKPDPNIKTVAQHLEEKKESVRVYSSLAASWSYFLEEEDQLFEDGTIDRSRRNQNITVDGLLRLIRTEVGKFSHPNLGAVTGVPSVLLGFDGEVGFATMLPALESAEVREMAKQWLTDIVEFTRTHRDHVFDPSTGSWVYVSRERRDLRPEAPIHDILSGRARSVKG